MTILAGSTGHALAQKAAVTIVQWQATGEDFAKGDRIRAGAASILGDSARVGPSVREPTTD